MRDTIDFHDVGRLPAPEDNAAIATRVLDAGTAIRHGDMSLTLPYTVLEGHRFAIRRIQRGDMLTSWGMPFGTALTDIARGDYVCNEVVLTELRRHAVEFVLPSAPNFSDDVPAFVFEEAAFQAAPPLEMYLESRSFMGYRRAGGRGTGTRNMIVLLGTTALTTSFVRGLESQLKPLVADMPNVDGIVAVAHTEGGHRQPNNRDLLMRTLAGYMVHSNVGAVLAVDYGTESVTNAMLREYLLAKDYPLDDVLHRFMSLSGSFQESLDEAARIVKEWLPEVNALGRSPAPMRDLKIALQCGGSDAFSGISGNPLAGLVAREIIRYGGSANLAETDELVGAEPYILKQVRDLETARRFLGHIERFRERTAWHGHSVEGNPSGGNVFRGLYNIYLKSLGAATKRDPEVRLDHVIDYGQLMHEAGFYFMDSPGNDLESVAGQIASGCNLIFFITGNGSITNFPFVPTIKIVTTSERYRLLPNEMDVNAGAYLDGTPLEELGHQTLDLSLLVASGQRTAGEEAGHAQVQIWRDWRQTRFIDLESIRTIRRDGHPIPIKPIPMIAEMEFEAYRTGRGPVSDQIGLILPTSLCSGQIANMCAQELNSLGLRGNQGISRFVALMHTEGCGVSSEVEYIDTLLGYLTHPLVRHCLLLEHGCEKTHNGYMRNAIVNAGLNPNDYGWASIQRDGGIQAVMQKVIDWFAHQIAATKPPEMTLSGKVRLGLLAGSGVPDEVAYSLAELTRLIVSAGGTVIVPQNDGLLQSQAYRSAISDSTSFEPTINYARRSDEPGFHIMETTSEQWSEVLTGLGATGVEVMLAYVEKAPLQGHPLVPMLTVTTTGGVEDSDVILDGQPEEWTSQMLKRILSVLSRQYMPYLNKMGYVNFQITRGLLGVSL